MELTVYNLCRYLNFSKASHYDLSRIGKLINTEFVKVYDTKPERIKQTEPKGTYEVFIYPEEFKKAMKSIICRYFADKMKSPYKAYKQRKSKRKIL